MSDDLAQALTGALDRPAPHGAMALVRRSPSDEANRLVGDRVAAALPIVEGLARSGSSTNLRTNALTLWPQLLARQPMPSIEEIARSGGLGDRLALFRAAALELSRDPDPAVRATAAALLLQNTSAPDLPAVRAQLAHTADDLAALQQNTPTLEQGARLLAGSGSVIAAFEKQLAQPGRLQLPTDALTQLGALADEPVGGSFPTLAALFLRLPAVSQAMVPAKIGAIPGVGALWDVETSLALATVRAMLPALPPEAGAEAAKPLRAAHFQLLELCIGVLLDYAAKGARCAAALAADPTLETRSRERAIFALSGFLSRGGEPGAVARAGLEVLRGDAAVGGTSVAALGGG